MEGRQYMVLGLDKDSYIATWEIVLLIVLLTYDKHLLHFTHVDKLVIQFTTC